MILVFLINHVPFTIMFSAGVLFLLNVFAVFVRFCKIPGKIV